MTKEQKTQPETKPLVAAVVRVEDFIDTYSDDRQEILEGYIDGTGWKMQEDCVGSWCPELERLFENAEIDPVVFTKGDPTPDRRHRHLFLAALTRDEQPMSDEKLLSYLEATWPERKIEPARKSGVKVCRGIRPSRVAKELVWRSDRQKSAPEVLAAQ